VPEALTRLLRRVRWLFAAAGVVCISGACIATVLQPLAEGAARLPAGASHQHGPTKTPAPYVAVKGNHLVNKAGQAIRLLGVDRSSGEYMCAQGGSSVFSGPTGPASVRAMLSWHINAVRLPLNEDCWLGINGLPPDVSGATYREAVERYVATLQAAGLIVILDLHWAAPGRHLATSQWPMADATHAPEFWQSVAKTFEHNHGVMFDLFNEPYISSWKCWLHGCATTYNDSGATVTYKAVGMQRLVDAVRSTGATQPLMLGGLAWSSDESGWLTHEPTDPDHQLVVSFHTYNFSGCNDKSCWRSTIAPLAKKVPIVTGELGESGCKDTYIDSYMPWADSHGISYLGWTWDSTGPPSDWSCSGGPALIVNYAGKPTAYGAGLKRHLAALAVRGQTATRT
jgi:Cellulase (glycosyl hydrolase family 5)